MLIPRPINSIIINNIRRLQKSDVKDVLIIEGARQVGKTSAVQEALKAFSESCSINLEKQRSLRAEIDATNSFAEFTLIIESHFKKRIELIPVLFIDEAQESAMLGHYVRFMKEEWKQTVVVLTGSSMTRLFREDQRVPVGRFTTIKVCPFTLLEFLQAEGEDSIVSLLETDTNLSKFTTPVIHQKLLGKLDNYLQCGGLPRIAIDYIKKDPFQKRLREIFLSQEDDFVRKTGVLDNGGFKEILSLFANQVGSQSHLNQINTNPKRAREVVSLLKKWHLIYDLELKSTTASTKFHPKRYLYDIGILQLLRNLPMPVQSTLATLDPGLRTALGGVLENFALISLDAGQFGALEFSGWRKSVNEAVEVDFVVRQGNLTVPIECKSSLKVTPRSYSSLKAYCQITGSKFGVLLSCSEYSEYKSDGIRFVNIPYYGASWKRIMELI